MVNMSYQLSSIEVAGVNHQDPLGLGRLQAWLRSLGFTAESTPAFVAVEYDPTYFSRIVLQRSKFRELMGNKWPFLSADDHTTLEKSLGYEGDAHASIFPDSDTLWLDNDRWSDPVSEASGYAQDRMRILCNCATSIAQEPDGFLCRLSQSVCAQAQANRSSAGDERDAQFAALVTGRTNNQPSNRAVAIVGASHARLKVSDSFVSKVRAAEIECRVQILVPSRE